MSLIRIGGNLNHTIGVIEEKLGRFGDDFSPFLHVLALALYYLRQLRAPPNTGPLNIGTSYLGAPRNSYLMALGNSGLREIRT